MVLHILYTTAFCVAVLYGGIAMFAALVLFLGSTLSGYGSGPSQADVLSGAILWPRTLWIMHKGKSLAEWHHDRELRKRRFTAQQAKALQGKELLCLSPMDPVPQGACGKVGSILGGKDQGYELYVEWTWGAPPSDRSFSLPHDQEDFRQGRVALA